MKHQEKSKIQSQRSYSQTVIEAFLIITVVFIAAVAAQVTEKTPGWFVFTIPGLDSSPTAIDLSWLNSEPAGAYRHLRVQDGHFVDGRGRRVKLFGTNLTATSCFPDKEVAPKLAAHLRKLGFNVVRFHFMDNGKAPKGIFADDLKSLDPQQLDKLDFLIAELKKNGIYSDINLHVASRYNIRWDVIRANRTFRMGKVLDNFYPPFIHFQKEYARALLTHKNPYTERAYVDEPAIAVVELNNENSLLGAPWGVLRTMPDPYGAELRRQWRAWLKARYGSTQKLRAAWSGGEVPLGNELIQPDKWIAQNSGGAESKLETGRVFESVPGQSGRATLKGLRWIATKPGTESWHLQFFQRGLTLKNGEPYTVAFWARSRKPSNIGASVMLAVSPWGSCGLRETVKLTPQFQHFEFVFRARRTQPEKVRLNFSSRNKTGVFEFAGISLRHGGVVGLPPDESFEAENISFPQSGATEQARLDFTRFLAETERNYVREMIHFLKSELGLKSLVTDTQASYGGVGGVLREATLCDFVDMHAYWQHPSFPGKPWDRSNWRIPNTSQVAHPQGGVLAGLAIHRVRGKPFTVSEYNTPAPNDHAAELFPLLATIAAYQDWDAIYQYTYSNFTPLWETDHIKSYFDLCGHTGQLAFVPVAALLFRQNLVTPARKTIALTLPVSYKLTPENIGGRRAVGKLWVTNGVPLAAVTMRRLVINLGNAKSVTVSSTLPTPEGPRVSDTGQIIWDPAKMVFTVNAPAARIAIGRISRAELGDVTIESDGHYACYGLVAFDGKPVVESKKLLLTVVARVENQDMGWDKKRTTVGLRWGHGPTVCKGVEAVMSLPGTGWRAQKLDGTGAPRGEVVLKVSAEKTTLNIEPRNQTLWYLLSR